jgi:hypothetical protein
MSETLFAAILGAVAGGAIGICGTYYATRSAHSTALAAIRITEFNKGASIFRAAFVDVDFLLQQNIKTGNEIPTHITANFLIAHEKAKILFEPFLPSIDLDGFKKAWDNYKNYDDNYLNTTNSFQGNNTQFKHMSEYCLNQIKDLLKFAQPK